MPETHSHPRRFRPLASSVGSSVVALHNRAATTALLWRIWVLSPGNSSPDRGNHVISRAVAIRDDALGGLGDRYPFTLEILAQPAVQLGQTAQLEVGHRLLVLLNLRRVADISRSVLRHLVQSGMRPN